MTGNTELPIPSVLPGFTLRNATFLGGPLEKGGRAMFSTGPEINIS